jgi:hypothetical protein
VISTSLPATGVVTVTWSATGAINYDVDYSRDNGATFQPLILHTIGTAVPIDTSSLGGGTAKYRVTANDGVNTASADSAAFAVSNKPPTPYISLPANNIHVHYGQVVNFSGSALDAQDGFVADNGLVWTSAAGILGYGPHLTYSLLPPDANLITLTAMNSGNIAASTTVTVNVDDDVDPDGPMLQVSPGSITWHVGNGVTTPQTTTLTTSNFGTGSLTWQVSSDAAWLTVSRTSGSNGDTLVATGNPAGQKDGETRSGQLTFTWVTAGVTQTWQLPVELIKGNPFQSPYLGPQPALRKVFLPLILRH